jgi:hypothetical protein
MAGWWEADPRTKHGLAPRFSEIGRDFGLLGKMLDNAALQISAPDSTDRTRRVT